MSTEARPRSRAADPEVASSDRGTRHGPVAQLLIAWSPLSTILVAYWVAQWVTAPLGTGDGAATNRLGATLHVLGPARVDESLFGSIPTVWLQARLLDGTPHWYDAVAALVYVTHFVTIPLLTAVAWFRLRDRFREWVAAVLTMTLVGVAGYVAYPAAPPWLAAERGAIGDVRRVSAVGWDWLHLDVVARLTELGQSGSNPVAAMPSLHAGAALLVALFLWSSVPRLARLLLAAYALAMALTLVYTGEHYVADVLAGWLVAVVGVAAGRAVAPPRDPDPAPGGAR
ncbi:Phosphoesterase PA-phosphatase related [metagenome]|uniref:Phosphoesterase PA-phosphatase related n=1 Tax=metagenome TaxID=256318 RepID=A0A2P2C6X3_9ZZZZ